MCGLATFGTVSESFILNNYAIQDKAAVLARIATGVSLYTSYPLIFVSLCSVLRIYKSLTYYAGCTVRVSVPRT